MYTAISRDEHKYEFPRHSDLGVEGRVLLRGLVEMRSSQSGGGTDVLVQYTQSYRCQQSKELDRQWR